MVARYVIPEIKRLHRKSCASRKKFPGRKNRAVFERGPAQAVMAKIMEKRQGPPRRWPLTGPRPRPRSPTINAPDLQKEAAKTQGRDVDGTTARAAQIAFIDAGGPQCPPGQPP